MYVEIQEGVGFVSQFLYDKLPRYRVDLFALVLANKLFNRFADGWDEATVGQRRLDIDVQGQSDESLLEAAEEANIDIGELLQHLPKDTSLYFDAEEVSTCKNSPGLSETIYPPQSTGRRRGYGGFGGKADHVNNGFIGDTRLRVKPRLRVKCVVMDPADDSQHDEQLEPFELETNETLPSFTAATFAQTRFGSIKGGRCSRPQPTSGRSPQTTPNTTIDHKASVADWGPTSILSMVKCHSVDHYHQSHQDCMLYGQK